MEAVDNQFKLSQKKNPARSHSAAIQAFSLTNNFALATITCHYCICHFVGGGFIQIAKFNR